MLDGQTLMENLTKAPSPRPKSPELQALNRIELILTAILANLESRTDS